jgi:hypothetical protein
MKMAVFWDVVPRSLTNNRRFRGASYIIKAITRMMGAVSASETSVNLCEDYTPQNPTRHSSQMTQ